MYIIYSFLHVNEGRHIINEWSKYQNGCFSDKQNILSKYIFQEFLRAVTQENLCMAIVYQTIEQLTLSMLLFISPVRRAIH